MYSILFVCLGNICRSPTADAICDHHIEKLSLNKVLRCDSAGTSAYHVGEPPDKRSVSYALSQGVNAQDIRSRKIIFSDFDEFDLILAMDEQNYTNLQRMKPANCRAQVKKLLDFSKANVGQDVPDPYYGGKEGFKLVFDLCNEAVENILNQFKTGKLVKNKRS
jgi:protein-tyrosine phosphatase